MNFFGHCAVARLAAAGAPPGVAFGAMLPDFAGMLRHSVPAARCPDVARGIRLHHSTDAVFHASEEFRGFEAAAREQLLRRGVRRGPARAAAHVGVELLLDAHLAEPPARAHYRAAVETYQGHALEAALALHGSAPANFASLLSFLLSRIEHVVPGDASALAGRLQRAFAGRPRIALTASETEAVERWATGAWDLIGRQAPDWCHGVCARVLEAV